MYLRSGEKGKTHLLCQELDIRHLSKASEMGLIVPQKVRTLKMLSKGAICLKLQGC